MIRPTKQKSSPRRPAGFDLSRFDTPQELVVAPFVDKLPRLLENSEGAPVHVYTQVGDDTLSYRIATGPDGLEVKGEANGRAFRLSMEPDATELTGELPGGEVSLGLQGEFEADTFVLRETGHIGELKIEETTRFAPDSTTVKGVIEGVEHQGHLDEGSRWTGQIGDQEYEQQLIPVENGLVAVGTFAGEPFLQWALKEPVGFTAQPVLENSHSKF